MRVLPSGSARRGRPGSKGGPPHGTRGRARRHAAFGIALALAALILFVVLPARRVDVVVDGETLSVLTRHPRSDRILSQAGITLLPNDRVSRNGDRLAVRRALPITIEADGQVVTFRTTARTVSGAFEEAGIPLHPGDRVLVGGVEASPHVELSRSYAGRLHGLLSPVLGEAAADRLPPVRVDVVRAVPFYVHDAGQTIRLMSPAPTISEALAGTGVVVGEHDIVQPGPDGPLTAGQHVYIQRAKHVTVTADGETRELFTHQTLVSQVLQEAGVEARPRDRVEPDRETVVKDGMAVTVTRIDVEDMVEEEVLPGDVVYQDDPDLVRGERRVVEQGQDGLRRYTYRVRYEDGVEVSRELLEDEVVREPKTTVIALGTKMPATMSVWVTCYQLTGTTYTGAPVGPGVVAVDPAVIPLYTRMEIPGYGVGTALDTGSGVTDKWVDVWKADCSGWATGWRTITILG